MSFRRRQFLALTLLLVLIMSANFVVSTFSARGYFSAQLEVLAADAATSLAFSISQSQNSKDTAAAQSMIDAVFDSGYYLSINYVDLDGGLIISKSRAIELESVPRWFVGLVDVPLSVGSAEVQSGWLRLGEIRVVAHPGFVIRDLWQAIIELFWFYCFVLVLSYGLMGLLLNYLTRPLKNLEQQAEAVFNDDYAAVAKLPKETEFRSLALAMNRMAERVRAAFKRQSDLAEDLRNELSTDALTKLMNRDEFDAQLRSRLESDDAEGPAVLSFISLTGLGGINASWGREYGDDVLTSIAAVIKAHANKHRYVLYGRRSGTDFSVFVPGMLYEEGLEFLQSIQNDISILPKLSALPPELAGLGFGATFSEAKTNLKDLYISADDSLRRYLSLGQLALTRVDRESLSLTASEWRSVLEKAIDRDNIALMFQEIVGVESAQYEVFCRIDGDSADAPAAIFWPLLERFDLSLQMDMLVVNHVISHLERFDALRLVVNVSPATAMSSKFSAWLTKRLSPLDSSLRSRLTIELKEDVFEHYDTLKALLLGPLSDLGVEVGVDGFGRSTSVIAHLDELALSYVKLDRRFTQSIDSEQPDRFYLITLVNLCAQNDVTLIAEGVERASQLSALQEFGLSHFQGYHFGLPKNEHEFAIGLE